MRRIAVLLALLPAAAYAGDPGHVVHGAASIEIAGPVEVPLLIADPGVPAVMVAVPGKGDDAKDSTFVALIDLTSSPSRVSEGTAKALGIKVHSSNAYGAPVKWAVIPELHVGTVVLHDVGVIVGGDAEVVLGCGYLADLATAIVPSRGVVKFVPAADGAALLAEVGTPMQGARVSEKAWYEHGVKHGPDRAFAFAGEVAGHSGTVKLATARASTKADPFDAAPGVRTETTVAAPKLGGVALASTEVKRDGSLVDPADTLVGAIGWDALYVVDIAADPATGQIAVKQATASTVKPATLEVLDRAKADYADANKPKDGADDKGADTGDDKDADDDKKDEDKVGKGDAGKAKKVSAELDLAPAYGDVLAMLPEARTEALAHYKAAADAAGDACVAHHEYGAALIALGGDPASAIPELQHAAEAYDSWMAQDRDTRARIAKGKNDDPEAWIVNEPSSCFKAWGDLAEAQLALGHYDQVAEIYKKHTDLDADLPVAYGISLLAQGQRDAAEGPLRQAMEMGDRDDAVARAAFAMTGEAGALSDEGLDHLVSSHSADRLSELSPVIEQARMMGGNAEALRIARAFVARDPLNPVAAVLLAREVPAAERAPLLAKAKELATGDANQRGSTVETDAWLALGQAIGGDVAGARAALAKHAGFVEAEVAASIIERDDGDLAAATAHRDVARMHEPLSAETAIGATRIDLLPPGLPSDPHPPKMAPAPIYTASCGEAAPAGPISGTWALDATTRVAFQGDRWCAFDATGAIQSQGLAASVGVYSCPAAAPAADQAPQEAYLVIHDPAGTATCNRFVAVGDRMGMYAQSCPGDAPYSTYSASSRVGEWTRSAEAAPAACWVDPAPVAPAPKKKGH